VASPPAPTPAQQLGGDRRGDQVAHVSTLGRAEKSGPAGEAIAVGRDGRILAVGTDSELLRNLGGARRTHPAAPSSVTRGGATGLLKDDTVNLVQQVIPRCAARTVLVDGQPAPTTLEPGKQADLVLVDRDVTRIAPAEIRDTKALLTMVGGEIVHEGPAAVPPAIAAERLCWQPARPPLADQPCRLWPGLTARRRDGPLTEEGNRWAEGRARKANDQRHDATSSVAGIPKVFTPAPRCSPCHPPRAGSRRPEELPDRRGHQLRLLLGSSGRWQGPAFH